MSNKQLNESTIVNELKGSSLFFRQEEGGTVDDAPPKDAPKAPVTAPAAPLDPQAASPTPPQLSAVQDPSQSLTLHPDEAPKGMEAVSPTLQIPVPSTSSSFLPRTEGSAAQQRTMVGSNEYPNERTNGRTKVRHSFDILSDQLFALRQLAVERERLLGRKVLLGDLVQEALDTFITRERNQE